MNDQTEALPGHWETATGREMAERYLLQERQDLVHGDLSDFTVANAVYLASRSDLDLIRWQTAAKERIRWLSAQLAKARGDITLSTPSDEEPGQ